MPLASRILQINLTPPVRGGGKGPSQTVTFDQTMDIRVRASKAALHIQNQATIEIFGMSSAMRGQLLSQVSAYLQGAVEKGLPRSGSSSNPTTPYWKCTIYAGYYSTSNSTQNPSLIFIGDVVDAKPISMPPNVGVQLTVKTIQTFRSMLPSEPAPTSTTLRGLVEWAATQMGVQPVCDTTHADEIVTNPARSIVTVSNILWWLQNYNRPNIAAFVDNGILYVKDRNKIVSTSQSPVISDFIGIPFWDQYGAQFETLFNQNLVLTSGVFLKSSLNPSLNNGGSQADSGSNVSSSDVSSGSNSGDAAKNGYVIYELEYHLCSRQTPFYVKCYAAPSG